MMKIREVSTFPFVYENKSFLEPSLQTHTGEKVDYKGSWSKKVFGNEHPLILELACGKGDYSLALAQRFPETNFIGVDIKGDRLWRAGKTALELNLKNIAFVRTKIEQLPLFFADAEISEIWITFPDPFPKKGDAKRRLTSPRFLAEYKKLVKPGGIVHLKTDAIDLFDYSEETIREEGFEFITVQRDIYGRGTATEITSIKTYYEKMHIANGRTINYLSFKI